MLQSRFIVLYFLLLCNTLEAQSPNVLLIIADDLGIDISNGYQDNETMPSTPNLDLLRANGLTYLNAWASPQCTPTRAAIMSGKYGIQTGVMRPPGNLDLEHESLFKNIERQSPFNYSSSLIGKWHIATNNNFNHPAEHGIDHYEGSFFSSLEDYYDWEKITNGEASQVKEYATTHLTNASIDWISKQDSPWFLWLAHPAPHSPFHIPPDSLFQIENTNSNLGKYVAAIEAMDSEIGRLLESLSEEERANTITIFIGDNGTPKALIQSFPGEHAKATLYEGGVRVPMIISGDLVSRKGEYEDALVQVTDLYATILEITGVNLEGGVHNSLSLKASLNCSDEIDRKYIYTDYEDGNTLKWAIRTNDYKLIEDENGNQEFYSLQENLLESENIIDELNDEQEEIRINLEMEADVIRNSWSCQDGIKNGEEEYVDDCLNTCGEVDVISQENIGCCAFPEEPSVYYEFVSEDSRSIYTNNFPNHSYCYNPNQIPSQKHYLFSVDKEPTIADEITNVVRENGRPARYFGVAKNGVIMAPAPAQPFIFENPSTGEFNWDWVFEPTNNQGSGPSLVSLDCSSAHTGGQGYHYHGDMFEYVESQFPGLTSAEFVPNEIVHIGWAGDGFPILYRYGPDELGNIKQLTSSYRLRPGLRPGDGIEEPCGPFSGKYTKDYEFICGQGDLDECNGVQRQVEVETAEGPQTFDYFYVITERFPQIPRCIVGNASSDFENSNNGISGIDMDNDGFLSQFDCDDSNPFINPNAAEIIGNDVDENCDGLLSSIADITDLKVRIWPNPSQGDLFIDTSTETELSADLVTIDGKFIQNSSGRGGIHISGIAPGIYLLKVKYDNDKSSTSKIIVE